MNTHCAHWCSGAARRPCSSGWAVGVDRLRVLEVGRGRGVGTEILLRRSGAAHVTAFDIDPDMVARARRRLASYSPGHLCQNVGDATQIALTTSPLMPSSTSASCTTCRTGRLRRSRSGGYCGRAGASSSKRSTARQCVAGHIRRSWSTLAPTGSAPRSS
jgi:Methyltransferase domain